MLLSARKVIFGTEIRKADGKMYSSVQRINVLSVPVLCDLYVLS